MSVLDVKNLRIALAGDGKTLVDGVSFSIKAGQTLALVGESGSGKSLTALSIMKLLGPQFSVSGNMHFDGMGLEQANMQALRGNDISMIFQEPMTALNPLHTIGRQIGEVIEIHQKQNVILSEAEGSRVAKRDSSTTLAMTKQLLEQVGLPHFKERLNAYPHQLSGGERQRVMIAMAIANKPKLLIADEPTTALDVHVEKTILELLAKLQSTMNMGLLFITHDLPLVKKMADHVAVMKQGKIVESAPVAELFSAPKHAYTKMLLDSLPTGKPVALPSAVKEVVKAKDITVKFPIKKGIFARTVGHNTALDQVSFELNAGETIGIVGGSGSGKTTLAMAMLRMQAFTGKAVLLGQELGALDKKALKKARAQMQLVFQDPFSSLNPRMTVKQIIGEGLDIHMPDATDHDARIDKILSQVGLEPEMKHRYPHEFSGGQRQRISIARAMVLEPKLVILDEPTSALDVTVQKQILDLLKDFQEKQQLSYMFITHDLRVIRTIAHKLIVLEAGNVVEAGRTEQILASPAHDYTKALVEAAEW